MTRFVFSFIFLTFVTCLPPVLSVPSTESRAQTSVATPAVKTFTPAPEFDMGSSVLKMIQGLAVCIALLLVIVWIQKKAQGRQLGGSPRSLKIIERLPTGPKTQILLISVKGRDYLVGQGSDSVNIYGEVVHDELDPEQELTKI